MIKLLTIRVGMSAAGPVNEVVSTVRSSVLCHARLDQVVSGGHVTSLTTASCQVTLSSHNVP